MITNKYNIKQGNKKTIYKRKESIVVGSSRELYKIKKKKERREEKKKRRRKKKKKEEKKKKKRNSFEHPSLSYVSSRSPIKQSWFF